MRTANIPPFQQSNVGEVLPQRDRKRRGNIKRLAKSAVQTHQRNDVLPSLALVDRDPRTLREPDRKVRLLDAAHVREVANSIQALGFSVPVLIDDAGVILDGVTRAEAAKLLNLPTIPCVLAGHLDAKERTLLRLASNRLAEKGKWDLDELQVVFEQLVLDEAPIEVSGFDAVEVDGILLGEELEPVEDGQVTPSHMQDPVSRLGDVFRLGEHLVICGDALDPKCHVRLMGGDLAAMVFTDVPYNVPVVGNVTRGPHREFAMASGEMSDAEFLSFNESWMRGVSSFLTDGGVLATFIDWRGVSTILSAASGAGLLQVNLVVWGKTNAGMGSLYRSQHELLPIFKKGTGQITNNVKLGKSGRSRSNLWTYPGASSLGSDARRGLQYHPTVKPAVMLGDALLDLTNRGDIVLDPFLGSGSTMIAADKIGRVCRGIEIDPLYVDLIARRYEEVTGKAAILDETGETFTALQQRRAAEQASSPASLSVSPTVALEANAAPAEPVYRKRTRMRVPDL